MNCTRCGTPLPPDSRFCAGCGAPAPASAGPPGGTSPPIPPAFAASAATAGIPPATGFEGTGVPAPPGLVSDCLRTGWAVFQRDWGVLIGMYLVYTILTAGPDWMFSHTFCKDHPIRVSLRIGTSALSLLLYPGFIVAGLKAVRGARVQFTDLFAGFWRIGAVLAYGILGALAVAFGMALLVLPGVILALGLSQAGYLVFDRGMGGIDGLKASWKLMTGYRSALFLLALALIGVNLLGLLALCIGFLVTAPLTAIVLAVFYERLRQWNGGALAGGVMPPGVTAT